MSANASTIFNIQNAVIHNYFYAPIPDVSGASYKDASSNRIFVQSNYKGMPIVDTSVNRVVRQKDVSGIHITSRDASGHVFIRDTSGATIKFDTFGTLRDIILY
jgi:hypothetical protein